MGLRCCPTKYVLKSVKHCISSSILESFCSSHSHTYYVVHVQPVTLKGSGPTCFSTTKKTHLFLYLIVCDAVSEEGRLPQLKVVNNGAIAIDAWSISLISFLVSPSEINVLYPIPTSITIVFGACK